MKTKEKILIAGGDMRQIYCALRLAEKYDVFITGFDEKYTSDYDGLKSVTPESSREFDYAVLPVPALGEGKYISSPCCGMKLSAYDVRAALKPDGIVFAGGVNDRLTEIFSDFTVIDYMKREDLCLLNAIPSAEGAVEIALSELPVTLCGLKVLITGCGRIGTALINILKGFGADITVAVRNARGAAKASLMGVKSCCTNNMKTDFGLVFNTVPSMIFDRELLSSFNSETLFIDLASKPGGIDFENASKLGIRVIWALGLPGKTAPVTSGEIIADTVCSILSERGEAYG